MPHRLRKLTQSTLLALTALSVTPIVLANSAIDDAIKYRQAGYTFMSWNMSKIKDQVVDGTVPFNQDQVVAAANAIAGIANSGMGALYPPGSDQGTGFKKTRLKPEFFQNLDEVGRVARTFNAAANDLAKAAAGGNRNEIRSAFGSLGESCKACHDKFRGD